ncbi:MAG: DUF488 family protein [Longimicrobiales bacterium]
MSNAFTIGHSTRTVDELIALLREHGIRLLVDVRRFPGSRRHPQFGKEALQHTLAGAGIAYRHAEALGGRRPVDPDSVSSGWRNAGFRGYADYMQTPEFGAALAELESLIASTRVAVMCAEAVPWRCHRNLIADALVAHGHDVFHIIAAGDVRAHALPPHARITGDQRVTYPGNVRSEGRGERSEKQGRDDQLGML